MAVLPLQLSIDSEVYPELHEMLCAIGSDASREERLRQLAAAGLVWERLRVQTHALGPEAVAALHADAAPATPPPAAPSETFVRELQSAVREFPVLTDVVDSAAFAEADAAANEDKPPRDPKAGKGAATRARAEQARPERPPRTPAPPKRAAPPALIEADAVHASAGAGTRSRLRRMKEKGLFKNE